MAQQGRNTVLLADSIGRPYRRYQPERCLLHRSGWEKRRIETSRTETLAWPWQLTRSIPRFSPLLGLAGLLSLDGFTTAEQTPS
jgi:hypothetical protein